ncbi:MAG: hypothetical protein COX70_02090 [Flavobacteriales bacterium CG_4_10_14_0_2_um_filter_32_8]|nr:MAG: hypothetical protein COX70_02090 [Flavobacteriales bacterium CG_4_10_14_0_2_um_filter_32_8]
MEQPSGILTYREQFRRIIPSINAAFLYTKIISSGFIIISLAVMLMYLLFFDYRVVTIASAPKSASTNANLLLSAGIINLNKYKLGHSNWSANFFCKLL